MPVMIPCVSFLLLLCLVSCTQLSTDSGNLAETRITHLDTHVKDIFLAPTGGSTTVSNNIVSPGAVPVQGTSRQVLDKPHMINASAQSEVQAFGHLSQTAANARSMVFGSAPPSPPHLIISQNIEMEPITQKRSSFDDKGYMYLRGAFPVSVINEFAVAIGAYRKNGGKFGHPFGGGFTIVDFASDSVLNTIFEAVQKNKKIHKAISEIFDGRSLGAGPNQYRFLGHNNINIGMNSPWHKDRLNGIYRNYERHSPWDIVNGAKMQVVKVAVYLEDHSKRQDLSSLRVVPGSHIIPDIPEQKYNVTFLHPAKGDVIIFDQRITHRGQGPIDKTDHPAPKEVNTTGEILLQDDDHRMMLQIGYGVNGNTHSDDFELGTRMRQQEGNNPECGYNAYGSCSVARVIADLKKRGLPWPGDPENVDITVLRASGP